MPPDGSRQNVRILQRIGAASIFEVEVDTSVASLRERGDATPRTAHARGATISHARPLRNAHTAPYMLACVELALPSRPRL